MLNSRREYLSWKRQLTRLNSTVGLRIAGIPESLGEDTDEQVLDLAQDIDVDIFLSDIDRSHRVGKPRTHKPRDIKVKFATYRARRKMLKARATTKDFGRIWLIWASHDLPL